MDRRGIARARRPVHQGSYPEEGFHAGLIRGPGDIRGGCGHVGHASGGEAGPCPEKGVVKGNVDGERPAGWGFLCCGFLRFRSEVDVEGASLRGSAVP